MDRLLDNILGRRFRHLVVLGRGGKNPSGAQLIRCLCDCGQEAEVQKGNLLAGKIGSCGCRGKKPGEAAGRNRYNNYRVNARRRGISFELTLEEFWSITQQDCTYCGAAPAQRHNSGSYKSDFIYNGIDRVDSGLGYVAGNCVPCCFKCNMRKRERSAEFFRALIAQGHYDHER